MFAEVFAARLAFLRYRFLSRGNHRADDPFAAMERHHPTKGDTVLRRKPAERCPVRMTLKRRVIAISVGASDEIQSASNIWT